MSSVAPGNPGTLGTLGRAPEPQESPARDRFGLGVTLAVLLHALLFGVLATVTLLGHARPDRWGENASTVGAIQASMVSAIPLPSRARPVEKSVLASEDITPTPKPPPKEATAPPPRPTDVLIKAKTPEKVPPKLAPEPTPAPPKHPQPTPATPKAAAGDPATQLPQSISQVKNGTATATVQDRTFGNRYAYYVAIVSRTVAQNWYTQEADPRASQGKRVTLVFQIGRDGTPSDVHLETRSGSPTLDSSALHSLQRIDGFGPLPAGDHITVEYTFDYRQP